MESNKIKSIFNVARSVAMQSDFYKFHLGCVAIYKGKVIAWFTTDIPIPTGPQRYYGLPGLIVELYYERTREGYSLKKVEQVSKEDYTFVPLTDENPISKEDMIYNYYHSKEVRAVIKAAKKKKK